MGRIVSIDYGLKRIGLAVSDEMKIIATFLGVIEAEKTSDATIKKILAALASYKNIETILVGVPFHMDGKAGIMVDEVRHFIEKLALHISCPIVEWDERLSTVQAERSLTSLSRKKRSKVIDGVTAVILLQSYLERLTFLKESRL